MIICIGSNQDIVALIDMHDDRATNTSIYLTVGIEMQRVNNFIVNH